MCARNGVNPRRGGHVIDSAAFARIAGRRESTIADLFKAAAVHFRPAKKELRAGRHEILRQQIVSGAFWVADRCRYTLLTVPTLPRDPNNPEDVPASANDHLLDAIEYAWAGRHTGSVQVSDANARRRVVMPDDMGRIIHV
jgi:hypothetical protein